ncbi:MAG: PilZ domain-containing protein [Pseudomonadota bacterium]
MRRRLQNVAIITWLLLPGAAQAQATCTALGHLLLATDLMQVAGGTGNDLGATYGPAIAASLSTLGQEMAALPSTQTGELSLLARAASAALSAAQSGNREELAIMAQQIGRAGQGLHGRWRCDEAESGPSTDVGLLPVNGQTTGPTAESLARGLRQLSADGVVSLRAALMQASQNNRVERAVILGCLSTLVILIPVMAAREVRKRRRSERHVYSQPTIVDADGVQLEARFFDVSQTGAKLLMAAAPEAGTDMLLDVGGQQRKARVARSGRGFAGVQFAQALSDAELGQLLRTKAVIDQTNRSKLRAARQARRPKRHYKAVG